MVKIIISVGLLCFAVACKQIFKMKKYEWSVTAGASTEYPMQILNGELILKDKTTMYILSRSFLDYGIGKSGGLYITGSRLKALPHKMSITWYSFCEEKFFSGEFDLPIEKIGNFFAEGFLSPTDDKKVISYDIIVSLAPNGKVLLFLTGGGITKEIGLFSAQENTEIQWEDFVSNPDYPQKKYTRGKLEQVFSESDFAELEKNGIDTLLYTEHYRSLFAWNPVIVGNIKPIYTLFEYFNAETDYVLFEKDTFKTMKQRPVPKEIDIKWYDSTNKKRYASVVFNEKEIFKALKQFSETGEGDIKMQFEISDVNLHITVSIRDDKSIYDLKECEIRFFKQKQ